MPINTAAKRYTALNVGCPWRGVNIQPIGAIDPAARLALAYLYSGLGAQAPVVVPDVVGQTKVAAVATLGGVGFVAFIETAYSSSVAVDIVISQDPIAGVELPFGSTITITVSLGEAPASTGAGRKRRRRRLVVEIDGQDFEVESVDQAVALLERAKEVAVKQIAKARTAPLRVERGTGIKRPSIRTDSEPLRELVRQKRAEIVSLYDVLLRDLEIQHLIAKADEDDEEETIIRLLM